MNSMITGLWPTVAVPASAERDLRQRIAVAQANARPEPRWTAEADRRVKRLLPAARRQNGRLGGALA